MCLPVRYPYSGVSMMATFCRVSFSRVASALDRDHPVLTDCLDGLADRPAPLFAPGERGGDVLGVLGHLGQEQGLGVGEPVVGEHRVDRARQGEHGEPPVDLGAGPPTDRATVSPSTSSARRS